MLLWYKRYWLWFWVRTRLMSHNSGRATGLLQVLIPWWLTKPKLYLWWISQLIYHRSLCMNRILAQLFQTNLVSFFFFSCRFSWIVNSYSFVLNCHTVLGALWFLHSGSGCLLLKVRVINTWPLPPSSCFSEA